MRNILIYLLGLSTLTISASCASSGDAAPAESASQGADDAASIVVTTNIIGDLINQSLGDLVGADVTIEVIIPVGAEAHEFAPSAQQAELMERADLLIVNGLGYEEGMTDLIANAQDAGVTVIPLAGTLEGDHDDTDDDHDTDHDDTDHDGDTDHDDSDTDVHDHGSGTDPHVWLDPPRVASALRDMITPIADATGLARSDVEANVERYIVELDELDASIQAMIDTIAAENRLLVTNHNSFQQFADRYGLSVVATIVPSVSTSAETSAGHLEEVIDIIEQRNVRAIFSETTESDQLAVAVSDEFDGAIPVVELYTESLGEPGSGADTYISMMTVDASRIAEALG